ncbi:unnamed protein product [Fraxinus pennsylvanica]|uniref:BZIP domain-containing protein n=1 Tax=Fraxinus pennsylvanica TaxID=56036 RepID=A0AAD1ZNC3_9LAMI|nr:unnamed protein product [Fraxinus pennsylvanica]
MDNEKNGNTSLLNGSLVRPGGEKQTRNHDDLLNRRLKNRERQRRYRARKRHETDLKKALTSNQSTPVQYQKVSTENQSTPLQVKVSQNVTSPDSVTPVHCQRDWKRDARRAHANTEQEIKYRTPSNSGTLTLCGGPSLQSGLKVVSQMNSGIQSSDPIPEDNTTQRSVPSRRHWKAEARNKKI